MPRSSTRDAALKQIHAAGARHNVDTKAKEKGIKDALDGPEISRVLDLLDQIAANPAGAAPLAAEGTAILQRVLVTVGGVTAHVLDAAKAMGATPDPLAVRTAKAVEYALSGTLPTPGG